MNERIKELAVQADLLIKKTNGDEFRYGNFDPKFQKFAELIVQECAKQVNGLYKQGGGTYGETILKHFDIKL